MFSVKNYKLLCPGHKVSVHAFYFSRDTRQRMVLLISIVADIPDWQNSSSQIIMLKGYTFAKLMCRANK